MKNQALFSSKDKSKKIKCRSLQFLYGALRVKALNYLIGVALKGTLSYMRTVNIQINLRSTN